MRIKEILSQNRRDFSALFVCPFCGYEEEKPGYDDANFHLNVIPKGMIKMRENRAGRKKLSSVEYQNIRKVFKFKTGGKKMNTKGGLTKRNTAVAGQKKDESLQGLIRAMEPEIKKALPSVITPGTIYSDGIYSIIKQPAVKGMHSTEFLGGYDAGGTARSGTEHTNRAGIPNPVSQ